MEMHYLPIILKTKNRNLHIKIVFMVSAVKTIYVYKFAYLLDNLKIDKRFKDYDKNLVMLKAIQNLYVVPV